MSEKGNGVIPQLLFRAYPLTTSGGQEILSTPSHPYYTQRGYINAQNLRAGDILHTVNGETVIVEAVQHELLENSQILYNFEVDGNNNYFVAENANEKSSAFILVHNYCNTVYIAKVTNKNGVDDIYVGRTKRGIAERFPEHARKTNKYPRDLAEIKTLDDNLSNNEMRGLEQRMLERARSVKGVDNKINAIAKGKGKDYLEAADLCIERHGDDAWIEDILKLIRKA